MALGNDDSLTLVKQLAHHVWKELGHRYAMTSGCEMLDTSRRVLQIYPLGLACETQETVQPRTDWRGALLLATYPRLLPRRGVSRKRQDSPEPTGRTRHRSPIRSGRYTL